MPITPEAERGIMKMPPINSMPGGIAWAFRTSIGRTRFLDRTSSAEADASQISRFRCVSTATCKTSRAAFVKELRLQAAWRNFKSQTITLENIHGRLSSPK